MTVRIHEVHPMLVHFPIALLPVAVVADGLGWLLRRPVLMELGKQLMPIAAGSAALSGATGLVAQEAVRVEGPAHDLLITHRNLNIGLLGLVSALAAVRLRRTQPGAGYLLVGLGTLAVMMYTAYLGGKMVYGHGVGVEPANGIRDGEAPEIRRDNVAEIAKTSARHAGHALEHALEHAREGELAPTPCRHSQNRNDDSSA